MNIKIRLAAAVCALGLVLCGCAVDLQKYPRVSSGSAAPAEQTLTLGIPDDADGILYRSMEDFADRVRELSGGSVTVELSRGVSDSCQLRLADVSDLIYADSRMEFLSFPYLFESREDFLAVCGAQDGPVMDDRHLRSALGGRLLCVFYGGSVGYICRSRMYPEIGMSESVVGLLPEGWYGRDVYLGMEGTSAQGVSFGSAEKLCSGVESGKIKFAEYLRSAGAGGALPSNAKYYEDTCHRYMAWWLVLSDGCADSAVRDILSQSAAYVVSGQNESRDTAELDALAGLPKSVQVNTGEYSDLFSSARRYYRDNRLAAGIPDDIWSKLEPLLW